MPPLKKSIGSSIKKKPEALPPAASKKAKTSSLKEQQAHKSMLNAIDKFYTACEEDDAIATHMLSSVVGYKRQFDEFTMALIKTPSYSSAMNTVSDTLSAIIPRTKEFNNTSVITKKKLTDELNKAAVKAEKQSSSGYSWSRELQLTLFD